ncbi:hypothetical protein [Nocardia suismassiliense]|uniref:hypothetical protein n=1 Tax=Nocardia suismassiliense TaxID=2077092 RepID=UPI000D1FC7C1|nr:hypothetical protein [Nocardia suismassiliense]
MATTHEIAAELGAAVLAFCRATATAADPAVVRASIDFAGTVTRIAETLGRVPADDPGAVHLVGIDAVMRDMSDLDSCGAPQQVKAAFADAGEAQRWADQHNATVPWSVETKTVVLGEIPYVPAGAPGPDPTA